MKFFRRVLFLLIVILMTIYVSRVLCLKMCQFYNWDRQASNTIEVLGIGSSRMYCTLNTMRLYEKFGIKAFLLVSSGQRPVLSQYFLRQAFKSNQSPSVVLVELSGFLLESDLVRYRDAHAGLDDMPWGINKARLIWDMRIDVPKSEFVFNLLRYHSRWKELAPWEFDAVWHPYIDRFQGFVPFWAVSKKMPDLLNRECVKTQEAMPLANRMILDDMVSCCESHGSKLVFMIAPFDGMWRKAEVIAALRKYADQRRIPMIVLTRESGVDIDSQYDFKDPAHLNAMGAEKATDYIGAYLMKAFGGTELARDKEDPEWLKAVEEYKKQREKFLKSGVYGGKNDVGR